MKKKFYIMAVVLSLVLMTIPFWGAFASPGGYTLTFDAGGGTISGSSQITGLSPGALVTPDQFPGVSRGSDTFIGWMHNGAPVTSPGGITINGNTIVVAHWQTSGQQGPITPTPAPSGHTIIFDFGGGTTPNGAIFAEITVTSGAALSISQIPVPRNGFRIFQGWQIVGDSTSPLMTSASLDGFVAESNMTFIARWGKAIFYTVNFLPGDSRAGAVLTPGATDGGLLQACGRIELQMEPNTAIAAGQVPTVSLPAGSNWVFTGWVVTGGPQCSAADSSGAAGHVVIANTNFTAQFAMRVTFDLAGGRIASTNSFADVQLAIPVGGTIDGTVGQNVPVPVRDGFFFIGWQRVTSDGAHRGPRLSAAEVAGLEITNDNWLFVAIWGTHGVVVTPAPTVVPPPHHRPQHTQSPPRTPAPSSQPVVITVRLAPGAGTLPANTSNILTGPFGFRVADLPTPIAPAGYEFDGWFMHNVLVTGAFAAVADVTLYAHYNRVEVNPGTMITLTFIPAGGVMPTGVSTTQTHAYGTVVSVLPIPSRTGFVFSGWNQSGSIVAPPLTLRQNMTLTAMWLPLRTEYEPAATATPAPSSQPTPAPSTCPTATPAPSSQPTPAPSSCPVVPTPAPSSSSTPQVPDRFNPQTGPLQISFAVFGAVMFVGLAAFGIMQLVSKQKQAAGEHRQSMTRQSREDRIVGMLGDKE